jgi:hypothetical protein
VLKKQLHGPAPVSPASTHARRSRAPDATAPTLADRRELRLDIWAD